MRLRIRFREGWIRDLCPWIDILTWRRYDYFFASGTNALRRVLWAAMHRIQNGLAEESQTYPQW